MVSQKETRSAKLKENATASQARLMSAFDTLAREGTRESTITFLRLTHFTSLSCLRHTKSHLITCVPRGCTCHTLQVAALTRLAGCACRNKVCKGPQQLHPRCMFGGIQQHVYSSWEIQVKDNPSTPSNPQWKRRTACQ